MNKNIIAINDDLMDLFRFCVAGISIRLNDNIEKNIVSKQYIHDEFINKNSNISNEILNFYYLPTRNLISDEEFDRFVKSGFIGKKDRITNPFSIKINNAYHKTSDILYKIKLCKELEYKINKQPILNLNDLIPYFDEYEKGFEVGFNDFEKDKITAFLPMFPDKNDFVIKTFEFLINRNFSNTTWLYSTKGFSMNLEKEIDFQNAHKNGIEQGYFYKAWYLVFSNNYLFEPLFKQWFIDKETKENKNIKLKPLNPKKIESENWFIIGLKFATGELYNLIKVKDNNFTQVAKELGNEKGYRPYISETYNNSTNNDKNIYSKPKKIKSIYDYCTENNIQMTSTFIDAYNLNESK